MVACCRSTEEREPRWAPVAFEQLELVAPVAVSSTADDLLPWRALRIVGAFAWIPFTPR
jgi:hypothetical protein